MSTEKIIYYPKTCELRCPKCFRIWDADAETVLSENNIVCLPCGVQTEIARIRVGGFFEKLGKGKYYA